MGGQPQKGETHVGVVTDSVACLPPDVAQETGIHCLPVRITVGGTTYADTDQQLPASLVCTLRNLPHIDTTPWPPEHYARFYCSLSHRHSSILHVAPFSRFTSTMSLAMEGARLASISHPDLDIAIVDSQTTGMAQAFVALAAAHAALSGASLSDCHDAAQDMVARVTSLFTLASLDHLARTGRVSRLAAWAGSRLRVTPVVRLAAGHERPFVLARSRLQAIRRMADEVTATAAGRSVHAAVMQSDPDGEAETILRLLTRSSRLVESHIVTFTPVMRVVSGPGVVGVAFYCD